MQNRIPEKELRHLRNNLDINAVIDHLHIPWKVRDGYVRFLCPLCSDFDTATNPTTNLARCFRCKKNFNPIDLVMVELEKPFLHAVQYLRLHAQRLQSAPVHQIAREYQHR
jgi:hypothetical protein